MAASAIMAGVIGLGKEGVDWLIEREEARPDNRPDVDGSVRALGPGLSGAWTAENGEGMDARAPDEPDNGNGGGCACSQRR